MEQNLTHYLPRPYRKGKEDTHSVYLVTSSRNLPRPLDRRLLGSRAGLSAVEKQNKGCPILELNLRLSDRNPVTVLNDP